MMDLALTGNQILSATIGIAVVLIGLVFLFKNYLSANSKKDLSGKYAEKMPAYAIKKYPEADVFRLNNTFLKVGFIVAIGLSALAFSWTQYNGQLIPKGILLVPNDDMEIEIPRIPPPPPAPLPPPPPVIEEVPDDEIEEEVIFEDLSVDDQTMNTDLTFTDEEDPAPPIIIEEPEEPEVEIPDIFVVAEQMPRFPGCEDLAGNDDQKAQCAEQKLLQFIYKNIKYPNIARENNVQGMVVVQFVVDKNGNISAPSILRDIGAGCGEEALRVVNLMNKMAQKWTPGKQRNEAVNVQYNLPIRFQLER